MSTQDLGAILANLFGELVYGSPDPTVATYMLNRGDSGLLGSLERIDASEASASVSDGATIAGHVDHLRYGLSLLNRWAGGEDAPWKSADWTKSWRMPALSDASWRALRDDLRREADTWRDTLRTPRDIGTTERSWVIGSIAHLGYHLGAIRQISRAARGPTAEDEQRFQT